jgi:hypothetical protein
MSRDSLPCPPQMRNGGSPPTHLSPSNATLLDAPHWLLPPQRAPDCTKGVVGSVILAHHGAIHDNLMIALRLELIAQNAELARHDQGVEAKRSKALAQWRHREDTVHAKALAIEADMHCCHKDTTRAIMATLAMHLDTLASTVASWIRAEDCSYKIALCEMQSYNKVDVATLKRLHEHRVELAANAQWEDDEHP